MSLIHKSLEQLRRKDGLSSGATSPNQSMGTISLGRRQGFGRGARIIVLVCLLLVLGGIVAIQFGQDYLDSMRPDPILSTPPRTLDRPLADQPLQTADTTNPPADEPIPSEQVPDAAAVTNDSHPETQPAGEPSAQPAAQVAQPATDTPEDDQDLAVTGDEPSAAPAEDLLAQALEMAEATDPVTAPLTPPSQPGSEQQEESAFPRFQPETGETSPQEASSRQATADTASPDEQPGSAPHQDVSDMVDETLQEHFRTAALSNNRVMEREQALTGALAAGDLARASQELEGLLDLIGRTGGAALKWQGYFALREHNWTAAEDFYRRALSQLPADVESRYNLCIALIRLERFQEARALVARLAEERPLDDRVGQLQSLIRAHTNE